MNKRNEKAMTTDTQTTIAASLTTKLEPSADDLDLRLQVVRMREVINHVVSAINDNLVVRDGPHTVSTPDGQTHTGPLADDIPFAPCF